MKTVQISTVTFLFALFLIVTAMQYWKIEANQPLLNCLLLALNVTVASNAGGNNGKPA